MYDEGTWFPVLAYIQQVQGPAELASKPQAKQIQWVEEVCKQSISWMKGCPGVIVPDYSDGRKRIRVGQSTSTQKMVYLERAGCTLPWASLWMQTTMGPRICNGA